ncbi:MAG TPA: endonuclease/exonuclease/phosphatase family protein [Polyangiaceae bacterium]|jgi:endonuclease/exonuclease/phosphatase family metal-dependent hydrolase|nr:endonuclease/exonuclease/phosphatase family protein [Polyangiaceae bacterium]
MAFTLATFNVKNLFDPAAGAAARERDLVTRKVEAIAETLRACDADVVGLQEVGSPRLLQAVLDLWPEGRYREPVLGTADARGIRCALLSRLPVTDARVETAATLPFPVFQLGDRAPFGDRIPLRRGVVRARLASDQGPVHVLVVHFKSPLPVDLRGRDGAAIAPSTQHERAEGVLRSLVWRAAEALHARTLVDALLASDPEASLAVVGDFNDGPASPVVRVLRGEAGGAPGDAGAAEPFDGALYDCAARVEAGRRFSAWHGGAPSQIDHVLATAGLYRRVAAARFLNESLRDHGAFDPSADEAPTVDSDHAALVVRFE